MVVVGAAMEFGAREGIVEDREGCGSGRLEAGVIPRKVVTERENLCTACRREQIIELAFSWLGRRCAKTCGHTSERDWMSMGSGRIGQFASEGQLLRGEVGADVHVGSATRAGPGN